LQKIQLSGVIKAKKVEDNVEDNQNK